jgi:FMN phosphatase YigB (HAD superfamily)
MIKAIIFDLDNCLAPADEIGRDLLEPMFVAIRRANKGHLSTAILERALAECWRSPLDAVAHEHGFSDEMLAAGWEVAHRLAITVPMRGYPDLHVLTELPATLFLVTTGFRRLQESKIDALGFRERFEGVYVDAIDEPGRTGKRQIFQEILAQHGLDPPSVLVVGDNPASEIAAGNRLGIPTVQILRPGVARSANATHHVDGLDALRRLMGA